MIMPDLIKKILLPLIIGSLAIFAVSLFFISRQYSLIALIGIILFICAGTAYLIHLLIKLPIRRILHGVEMIQAGNLDFKIGLEGADEIGKLSSAIDHVALDIQKVQDEIHDFEQEIAEMKTTHVEIKEQEEYYKSLFEHANDPVFIYEFDGTMRDVNQKACALLGYTRKELMSVSFLDLYSETELTRSQAASKMGPESTSVRYESAFCRKDGSTVDVEVSSSVVDLKKGIMQSIITNITERKQMDRSLRESEEKFRTFMETASDMMFITDENGVLTYVNTAMTNSLEYLPDELVGKSLQDLYAEESLDESKRMRLQLMDQGEDLHRLVWETKTHKSIYGELKVMGSFDESGQFTGIRGIFRDLSERKKIENAQRLAEMGKMSADLAHEVKNQLAVLMMRSQIARMRPEMNSDLKEDLEMIEVQSTRMNEVIRRLLRFSKPSKGEFKNVDIHQTIVQVIELVEKQYSLHNVVIEKNLMKTPCLVNIDEKQIQEVIINLMGNAFEAMPDGGKIILTTTIQNEQVQIDVADTGSGISEADLNRIFDPFFTTKEEGTGLGLSVCYGTIQAHNGELRYESEIGKGTIAHISLPIAHP